MKKYGANLPNEQLESYKQFKKSFRNHEKFEKVIL